MNVLYLKVLADAKQSIVYANSKELDKFLNEAEDGFIYFSLGSMISPEDMPQHVLNLFVKVFSNLEQRVLWKWDEDIPKLTTNIKVEHWLPQQDILGTSLNSHS